jgi:hypothetical protein
LPISDDATDDFYSGKEAWNFRDSKPKESKIRIPEEEIDPSTN